MKIKEIKRETRPSGVTIEYLKCTDLDYSNEITFIAIPGCENYDDRAILINYIGNDAPGGESLVSYNNDEYLKLKLDNFEEEEIPHIEAVQEAFSKFLSRTGLSL